MNRKTMKRRAQLSARQAVVFAGIAVVVAVAVLVSIFASGTPVAFEAESGTLAGGAAVVSAGGASGGSAVKFAAAGFVTGTTKPDATNTGPRIALVAPTAKTGITINGSGDITVTADNVTISGWDIHGYVKVNGNNFTLIDSRVRGRVNPAAAQRAGYVQSALVLISAGVTGTDVEYSEIATDEYDGAWINGVSGSNFTVKHCNMHDTVDQFDIDAGNVDIEANYIHDGTFSSIDNDHASDSVHPYWTHQDGVQIKGGPNVTITGNSFLTYVSPTTSYDPDGYHTGSSGDYRYGASITGDPEKGAMSNLLIDRNWFDGGSANFQMSLVNTTQPVGAIQYNRFGMDQYNYGNNSRYQIRYAPGNSYSNLTTNYFDPDNPDVPSNLKGVHFTDGFTSGIRSP